MMEIILTRRWQGPNSTLGIIRVDGDIHQYVLEDTDRGLLSSMRLSEIANKKVYGKTAIPEGRYRVVITYSNRFKRFLPLLINVQGYSGIRMHPGNRHINTEGCLLPGRQYMIENKEYVVLQSKLAADSLQNMIAAAINRKEEVWITICSQYEKK